MERRGLLGTVLAAQPQFVTVRELSQICASTPKTKSELLVQTSARSAAGAVTKLQKQQVHIANGRMLLPLVVEAMKQARVGRGEGRNARS